MDKPGMIKLSNQQAAAIDILKRMLDLFEEWDAEKIKSPFVASNTSLAKCPGRKTDVSVHPLWRTQCINCQRRMAITKPSDVVIKPWAGHGACPDKVEMAKP